LTFGITLIDSIFSIFLKHVTQAELENDQPRKSLRRDLLNRRKCEFQASIEFKVEILMCSDTKFVNRTKFSISCSTIKSLDSDSCFKIDLGSV